MSGGFKMLERPRQTSRRGCGWGSAITTCSVCGKVMIGHNRGICSKCMRRGGGSRRPTERVIIARHFGDKAFERDMKLGAREIAFAQFASASTPAAEVTK